MFKHLFVGVISVFAFHVQAMPCDSDQIIYHAEEKVGSRLTQAPKKQSVRLVELCLRADGFVFYFGPQHPDKRESIITLPRSALKIEPESPKGGFNFTHNNIEYSLFEDELSILYLYDDQHNLVDAIELDNQNDNYRNKLF